MWLLEERGQVAPYGISIVGEHGELACSSPKSITPEPFSELMELVVARALSPSSRAASVRRRGGHRLRAGGGASLRSADRNPELEPPRCFQYRRMLDRWMIDEPKFDRELLIPDGVCWPSRSPG